MRYGEDYWTPEEAENGMRPSTAVYDAQTCVYREVIEDDESDDDDEPRDELMQGYRAHIAARKDVEGRY